MLFESATFCLCVCKCMLTDACLYAYVVWVCLCCVASICRVLACVRVDSYVCVSTSILIRGLPHPQRLLKSPWPGGDPHPIQNFKMKIFRFKFRGCCLNKRTWMIPIHTRHVRMHACHAACHAHEINFIRYSPQPFCPQPPSPDWGHNSHFNQWVQSRHSSSSSGMAGSEAPRFALRCSGLFLVRRFRACRTRQQTFFGLCLEALGR